MIGLGISWSLPAGTGAAGPLVVGVVPLLKGHLDGICHQLPAVTNKCHASSNRCLTSSNKKLLETSYYNLQLKKNLMPR